MGTFSLCTLSLLLRGTLCLFVILPCVIYGVVFPSRMEGQYAIESFHTVELKIGTPCKAVRLVVDFASTGVKTKLLLPLISRSFSPALGGSDVIHFGGHNFRVPVVLDGGAQAEALGCADCLGSIGIGPGSKLWLYFQDVIFTPGSVIIDEPLIAYTSQAAGDGWFDCLPAMTNLCTVSGAGVTGKSGFSDDPLVGKVKIPVTIRFGIASFATIVPPTLYEAFTQGRNIQKNSNPDDWPDIVFDIPATAGGGDDNRLTLRSEDIVTASRRTGHDLLLKPGSDATTVILGRSAWRSFMLRRRMDTGEAQVVSWCSRKHWTNYGLFLIAATSILFVYWKLSPSGGWKTPGQAVTWGPMWKILSSALIATLGIVTYALPMTQKALKGHLDVNIFVGTVLGNMILWQIFAAVVYLAGGGGRILGSYMVPTGGEASPPPPPPPPQPVTTLSSVTPSSMRFRPSNGEFVTTIEDRAPASSRMPLPLVYLVPRLWVIMSAANETVIILIALMAFAETRAESLGTFFILLASLFLLYNLTYHAIVAFFISTSNTQNGGPLAGTGGSVLDGLRSYPTYEYDVVVYDRGSRGVIRARRRQRGSFSHRQVSVRWSFVWALFWVCVGAILIAVLCSAVAAYRAARLQPVEALRYE